MCYGCEKIAVDLGGISDMILDLDDLDDQTKRELLIGGPPGKSPDPRCKWCGGTGRLKLLVSETECDCVR